MILGTLFEDDDIDQHRIGWYDPERVHATRQNNGLQPTKLLQLLKRQKEWNDDVLFLPVAYALYALEHVPRVHRGLPPVLTQLSSTLSLLDLI